MSFDPNQAGVAARLSIEVSGVVLAHLRELVASGMHGLTVEQCAAEQLRRTLLAMNEAGLSRPRPPS